MNDSRDDQLREQFKKTRNVRCLVVAIGRSPHAPPDWAVEACIDIARRDRQAATNTTEPDRIGGLLDEMIRCFADAEDEAVANGLNPPDDYRPPSLASIMDKVLLEADIDHDEAMTRRLRRAWDREQAAGYSGGFPYDTAEMLRGLKNTDRMRRVIGSMFDAKLSGGIPLSDPALAIYRARKRGESNLTIGGVTLSFP